MKQSKLKFIWGFIFLMVFGINQIGFTLTEYFVNRMAIDQIYVDYISNTNSLVEMEAFADRIFLIAKIVSAAIMICATIPAVIVAKRNRWDILNEGVVYTFVGIVLRILNVGMLADIFFLMAGAVLIKHSKEEKKNELPGPNDLFTK